MLTEQIKNSKNNASKIKSINLNDYMIKIDYFDKKGTKNFQNNIPLMFILNPVIELSK